MDETETPPTATEAEIQDRLHPHVEATLTKHDRTLLATWQKQALARAGVTARIEAVGHVLRDSPFFYRGMKREIRVHEARNGKLRTLDWVRDRAMQMLAQDFGLDLDGVDLHTSWNPTAKILTYRAAPSVPALMQATTEGMDALRKRKAAKP